MKRALRTTAVVVVIALVASIAWARQVPKAFAGPPVSADQNVQDIWNGLDALQSFSQGLATDGTFGQTLTDVGLTPGSPDGIGFSDLLQKLLVDRLTAANPMHLSDLVNALKTSSPIDLEANGRSASVSLTSQSGGGIDSLSFDVTVNRRVASSPLTLKTTSPNFEFAAPVQVDLAFHATFTVDYDSASREVYIDAGANAPVLTLTADAHFPCSPANAPLPCATQDTSAVKAGIGVLGVSLDTGSKLDVTTSIKASLRDPNNDGRVALGTFASGTFHTFQEPDGSGGTIDGELIGGAASAGSMVSVGFDVNPGALHATLNLTASVDPQLSSVTLPGVNANLQIDWNDITTGSPSVQITGGSLANVQSFENLSPADLAQALARLATALEGIQMSRSFSPANNAKTGTTAAISSGNATSTYTKTGGGDPAVGDFFQIGGGATAPVREVTKVDGNSSPFTLTFNSPVNNDVSDGTTLTQVNAHGDIDLPFMKGSLADVFKADESIVQFITKHVKQGYNPLPGGRAGTISGASGQTATYTVVSGGAPQSGDYYQIGTDTKKVNGVSGSGPYTLTLDTPFASAPADGTAAVQVQLGDVLPDFSSLQSMLVELKTDVGLPADFSIGDVNFDSNTSKLSIGLGLGRTQGSDESLDPFTQIDSGTGTYGTDTASGLPNLTDGSKSWNVNAYAGHMVKAGGASNIVKSNDKTSIVFAGPWHGTVPTNGTAYQIGGQDSEIGAVSFANKLDELTNGSGIKNANALVPVATVKPSYNLDLTLVLDLQSPKTGNDCVGMSYNGAVNNQACPFTANNTDGSSTVVSELPTRPDRIMIRTKDGNNPAHLLTADAPIHSQVDIKATVGFLGVHLTGTLDECAQFDSGTTNCPDPASASTHLLNIDFASGLGDAQGDIPLSDIFTKLASDPTSLIDVAVHGQIKASITPDIPGVSDFFSSPPKFTLSMDDITDPSSISFDAGTFTDDLAKIKAFNFDTDNPQALFGEILQTLKTLSKFLKTVGSSQNSDIAKVMGTKIPVVGMKLGDVFGSSEQGQGANVTATDTTLTDTDANFLEGGSKDSMLLRLVKAGTSTGIISDVSPDGHTLTVKFWQGGTPAPGTQYQVENALDSAIDLLTSSPTDDLQGLIDLLNQRLGASIPFKFDVDTNASPPQLGIALDWNRTFDFTTPVQFDFKVGGQDASIVGTQAKGLVKLHATAEAKVKLLLNLQKSDESGASDASTLQVDPTNTGLSASVGADASGFVKANLGPLSLSLGQPVDSNPTYPAEGHGTFSASLASSDTSPESISAFLSSIGSSGVQFNQGATAVSCNGDTTPNLGLCAALPVYLSTDGGNNYTPVNGSGVATDPPDTLRLRLPLSGDLSTEFSLEGKVDPSDNTSPDRIEIPPSLATDLQKAVLDFSQLGGGLDGYFKFAEQALNLASFGGKLPLIGKDLQQGAQFLENLQQQIDTVTGDLGGINNATDLKTWISNKLESALGDALPAGSHVTPDFICSENLATPTNVQGTPSTAGATKNFYVVSATDPSGETVASSPAQEVDSAALGGANTIALTWNKVDGAAAYKVYRSPDGTTGWAQFDAAQADNPTFTDKGDAGTPASPKLSGDNPPLDPCPLSDMTGVTLTADIGQGDVSADKGCEDNGSDKCIVGLHAPLNIGIPGLSISAANNKDGSPDPNNEVNVKLGWRLHLKIGITKTQGFFIETQDQKDPELRLGVAVTLPPSIEANIAFLKIDLCNYDKAETYPADNSTPPSSGQCPFKPMVPNSGRPAAGDPTPLFAGEFGIDLHTPGGDNAFQSTINPNDLPANNITLSDFTNFSRLKDLVTVGLSAQVHIDWDFKALVSDSLPGVGGEFKLDWKWGAQLNGNDKPAVASDTGDDATPPTDSNGAPDIEFDNVYITAGGFLGGVLKPIIKEVQSFTSPLKPVIDTLYAPIPVLSDLSHLVGGGDVTLISIAEAFSTLAGGPDLTMVERILEVIKVVNSIPVGDGDVGIFIGTFNVSGAKAIGTTATPDNTNSLIDNPQTAPDSENGNQSVSDFANSDTAAGGAGKGGKVGEVSSKAGFSFPVLDKPSTIFNLLMGGDIDLIRFDSGNLSLGFTYSQQFGPVYAPPPVLITLSGSASVTARIIAGFDTYGLRKAFEAIKSGNTNAGTVTLDIIDSLFLYTTDPVKGDGKPVPVLTLHGEIAAGAEVSVVIVTVGVEGGIGLTINFYWNDPDNDGKFRTMEFLGTALSNPLCLFNMDGKLTVFLRVFITIGIGPFSVSFSFTLVDITLLDFTIHPDCTPPPPELGEVQGTTLYLFFGALGKDSERGSPWGNNNLDSSGNPADETVKVHELHNDNGDFTGFAVDALNRHEEFLDSSLDTVVFDGKGYGGKETLTITGDSNQSQPVSAGPPTPRPFDKTAIVFGGNNDDNIKIDGGTAHVDGGGGNDIINLANGNDNVAGGPGDDNITVGNGDDKIAGDSALPATGPVTLSDHRQVDPDNKPHGSWSNVSNVPTGVGDPTDAENSDDGNDTIAVGYGQNTIYGNGGDDSINVATDIPLSASQTPTPGVNEAKNDTIIGGKGNNHIHSGSGDDQIWAGQKWTPDDPNATGVAGDGTNNVDTGTGSDIVRGGSGPDMVVGHSKSPTTFDTFYGAGGSDILIAGDGADKLYGGPDDDYLSGGPAKIDPLAPTDPVLGDWRVTQQPDGNPQGQKLLVGGDGNDHIYGTDGGNTIFGDREENPCALPSSGPRSTPPGETSTGSPGNDYIIGGIGVDTVAAGGGQDYVDGRAADDLICGQAGDDHLIGGTGNDTAFGGSGNDLMEGGDGNDNLYGNANNDIIFGGNGNDFIEGNQDKDWASGDDGTDTVIGGTSAAGFKDTGDTLLGGNQDDTIVGDNAVQSGGVWIPTDLDNTDSTLGGNDFIFAGNGDDTCHGGIGDDVIFAGSGNDHCEGNDGADTINGEAGEDELVGGGFEQASPGVGYPDSVDTINGGTENDVITGDNAIVTTVAPAASTDTVKGRGFTLGHSITLLDLGYSPTPGTSDGDFLHGNDGQDVIYGQGGKDAITGDNGDDYVEGGPAADLISGGAGNDDIVGGSSTVDHVGGGGLNVGQPDDGDTINGDTESDVIIGDNGKVLRDGTPPSPLTNRPGMTPQRAIVLYDLTGSGAPAAAAGDDFVNGNDGVDVILGQGGNDRLLGNAGDDYVEGDQGSDAIEGDTGDDDLVGGSSTVQSGSGAATVGEADTSDAVWGGPGDDVVTGDNALVLRTGPRTSTTDRLGTVAPGTRMTARNISLYDLNGLTPLSTPAATQFGDDRLSGGSGVDVMYGQDGNDQMSGGPSDDYMEGNGGDDILRGDARLDQPPALLGEAATTLLSTVWPGAQSGFGDLEGLGADGQDDMMGGSSIPAFRDGNDQMEGDGESDFQLGDNGTLKRDVQGADGNATERLYLVRYNPAAVPANASHIRMHDPAVANAANSNNTTRFCTTAQATCEPAGAFGDDTMWGDTGDDTMWGQDGNDTMHGGAGDDDMYGELGNDQMYGDDGEDAILGDRGGVRDVFQNGSNHFFMSVSQVPKVEFDGFNNGTVTRVTDLLHDIDGDAFVGSGTQPAMPHPGVTEGGDDRIRGGNGNDSIHAGFGDDLANGDSGADNVFGDDGADVLWGGKGCDQSVDTPASSPWCYPGGVFDPAPHLPSGEADPRAIDYINGGKGGTSAVSLAGSQGSDLLDWHPRGSYLPGIGCTPNAWPVDLLTGKKGTTTTVDPCSWFEMTNLNDKDDSNNQHHQGVDWEYGGWDRDVLQADVADNGPNEGDRMLDWNGSFNLYTQCPSSNGGYNAVRQHSPTWQDFLQRWVWAQGAGQVQSDAVTAGTSAFDELALVNPGTDNAHGSGSAYPSTPGHFDNPNACAP
jgi:Ca2+-binding RTX toxin-like protein